MRVFCQTDIGKKRSTNQDTFRYGEISEDFVWAAVCDGMGGVNGGDIASNTASDVIRETLETELNEGLSEEEIRSLMVRSVNEANSAVFAKSVDFPELKGMGTTVVLSVIKGDTLHLVHVGDSRAYLKNSSGVAQITEDHSFVQDLVNRGEITKEQARVHPHKNIITRSLGVHSMVESDYACFRVAPGDVLVICSDGLSDYLTEEILEGFMANTPNQEELVRALIAFALENGGSDNITVAAVAC